MYDEPYADDFSDPFADATEYADGDWMPGAPARPRFAGASKALLALLVVGVVAGAVAGGYWLVRRVAASPADTVGAFYDSLNRRDYDAAAALIDPQEGVSAGVLANAESVAGLLIDVVGDELLAELDLEGGDLIANLIGDLQWEFRDMQYEALSQSGEQATVQAMGELTVTVLGYDLALPWSLTHDLVRRNGRWYLSLGF